MAEGRRGRTMTEAHSPDSAQRSACVSDSDIRQRGARLVARLTIPVVDLLTLAAGLVIIPGPSAVGAACAAAVWLLLVAGGSSRIRISPRIADDAGPILLRFAGPVAMMAPLLARGNRLALWVPLLTLALLLGGRLVAYGAIAGLRSSGRIVDRTIVLGAGQLGLALVQTLRAHPEYGLKPIGFVDMVSGHDLPLPLLGRPADVSAIVQEFDVDRIVVAFGVTREAEMISVLRSADLRKVEIHVMPRFFELGAGPRGRDTDDIWGIPLLRMKRSALRTSSWRIKRIFDLIVAAVLAVLLLPMLLLIAGMVKLSSPGPVLFRQRRVGQSGAIFDLFKFRTMRVNADSDTQWTVESDDRRTLVGRVLRRLGLDELPQLLNVVRGDMSLVGPRPERPYFVNSFSTMIPRYADRHRVPVGVTGWAQANGLRGDSSIPERARFDNQYIEHWSLWFDVMIICRTAFSLIIGTRRQEEAVPALSPEVSAALLELRPDFSEPGGSSSAAQ